MKSLPIDLKKKHQEIEKKWKTISGDWKKYNDQIIPEYPDFALEIMDYIIDVCEYVEKKYEHITQQQWGDLFYGFYISFYYGPNGDDRNYLDFDEANLYDIFCDTIKWAQGKTPSKEEFLEIKKRLSEAREKLKC